MSGATSVLQRLRLGDLAGARRLDLCEGLSELPREVLALADSLEVLNLSGNRLQALPSWLGQMRRLKVVFCSDNPFTELPEVLGECPALEMVGFKACRIRHVPPAALPQALRWLILTDNAIERLPEALGERPALQKLMLAGNRLQALPESLAQAQRLELLRLSVNRLTELPDWLLALPRLSWLALAGNPLGWAPLQSPLPTVDWRRLQVLERLGEGASGQIHRVQAQTGAPALALKLFKGAVTSDGLPEHEIAAGAAAGAHPALCTPLATLQAHPEGTQGLFLPLIPSGHVALAGPPSLASCTRDVYPAGWRVAPRAALRLLADIAAGVSHLHQRGVMHGDLYAHNIAWDPASGQALLGDFGAATLLPVERPAQARALQALEVRAFGCLLEEVLQHLDVAQGDASRAMMADLSNACLSAAPGDRPAMTEVRARIHKEASCLC